MESPRRLNFETLEDGNLIQINTDSQPLSSYEVRVVKQGSPLLCELTQKDQFGKIIAGPAEANLVGCGHWTTPVQNPTQRGDYLFGRPYQERALTINYSELFVGGLLVISDPSQPQSRMTLPLSCTEFNVIK